MGLFMFLVASVAISLSGTVTTDTDSTARPSEKPIPEPGPDWLLAKQQWGMAWELHWVGLGIGFACLSLNSLAAMFQFRFINSFARRNMFFAINGLLLTLGLTRSLYLWVDPYESGQNIVRCPLWIVRPLFGIAFPCLMSAFCLLHVAFLEVAKVQLGSAKLRNLRFIVCIIAFHFIIVLVSDTTVAFKADKTELLIVCQSFFIVWGLINSSAFLYSGSKVVIKAYRARKRICGIENGLDCGGKKPENSDCINAAKGKIETRSSKTQSNLSNNGTMKEAKINRPVAQDAGVAKANSVTEIEQSKTNGTESVKWRATNPCSLTEVSVQEQPLQFLPNTQYLSVGSFRKERKRKGRRSSLRYHTQFMHHLRRDRAVHRVAVITLITSVLSIACCCLQCYSLLYVYGLYMSPTVVVPEPWSWWAFQTSFRLVELLMGWTLSCCVIRSGDRVKKSVLTRFASIGRRTQKTKIPNITVIHVKDCTVSDVHVQNNFSGN